jgi:hypothetical protein
VITIKKYICKLPSTTHRVQLKTCPYDNSLIRKQTIRTITEYSTLSKNEISNRIKQLNQEWDIERVVELKAASVIIASTILSLKSKKCCFLITATVGGCLLSHVLCGWSPSIPIMRRMGIRTAEEINIEKIALKKLREDFFENTIDGAKLYNMVVKK